MAEDELLLFCEVMVLAEIPMVVEKSRHASGYHKGNIKQTH